MTATIAQLGAVKDKNKDATQVVLDAALAVGHRVTQVWGVGGGDHADGLATDFMVYNDRDMGDWIAAWIWANRGTLGVRWIIWRQRIISTTVPRNAYGPGNQWNAMPDRGNTTQNHMDHVHVMWSSAPVGNVSMPAPLVPGGGQSTPKPAPKPTPAPAKPAPKPKPAPTGGARPWIIAKQVQQNGVYNNLLRPGVNASTSVYLYQLALRRYLNKYAAKYNPSGATGNYGSETVAMTQAVYRDLAKKQPRGGWTPSATWPGPALLKALGLRDLGHS